MEAATAKALQFLEEELTLLNEVLESEKVRLAVEIRHTSKRLFRDDLKRRMELLETLLKRLES